MKENERCLEMGPLMIMLIILEDCILSFLLSSYFYLEFFKL